MIDFLGGFCGGPGASVQFVRAYRWYERTTSTSVLFIGTSVPLVPRLIGQGQYRKANLRRPVDTHSANFIFHFGTVTVYDVLTYCIVFSPISYRIR